MSTRSHSLTTSVVPVDQQRARLMEESRIYSYLSDPCLYMMSSFQSNMPRGSGTSIFS